MKLDIHQVRQLIRKYNVSAPRYTSYPTAPQFRPVEDPRLLQRAVQAERQREPANYSIYFHLPFCRSLCWYCGCTKVITRQQGAADRYLDYLEKEIAMITAGLHEDSVVRQVHFGGGTPTFLDPGQLNRLGEMIQAAFTLDASTEFSVEIDPRECTPEHVRALREMGCNRASLGVQDTDGAVQEAIHRIQPFDMTREATEELRRQGIVRINYDLIYGLPRQNRDTFQKTIDQVLSLNPDRLAIYNYAHIPSMIPSQRLLKEEEFPSPEEKTEMFLLAMEKLRGREYEFIGMDHFAQKEDTLSKALRNGTLQRNFQGYSTHAELEMIAFGMSAISQNEVRFYQNAKDLTRYYEMLDEGVLPVIHELVLSEEDRIRKRIIMQIMCSGRVRYEDFIGGSGGLSGSAVEESSVAFEEKYALELEDLKSFEEDGLLEIGFDGFQVSSTGRLFTRNIATVFDEYFQKKMGKALYSKTI